jgi:nitrogen fixation protein
MAIENSIIDFIIVVIALEVATLTAFIARARQYDLIIPVFSFFLSGGLILLAWRLGLPGSDTARFSLPVLALSGLSQLICLLTAWRALRR